MVEVSVSHTHVIHVGAACFQVGYISEYPHMGVDTVGPAEQGLPLHDLFWGGKNLELEDGKKVFGQIWPKVGMVG